MIVLENSLTVIAVALCVIGSLLLRLLFARVSLTFLVGYLLLTGFGFLMDWLLINPHTPYKALWLGLFMCSFFFKAPCLWLFAQETTTNRRPSLATLSGWEWVVVALGCGLTVPLILAAHSGILLVDPERAGVSLLEPIIHPTMLAAIGLFLLQVPWYLKKTWALIRTHQQRDFDLFSNIDAMPLSTLRVLIWLNITSWLLSLARALRALILQGPSVLDPLFTCIDAGVTVWALYVILKRCILFAVGGVGYSDTGSNDNTGDNNTGLQNNEPTKIKYVKSALDQTSIARIEKKLQQVMELDRIYTNATLKLRDLCELIGENPHYVSQVINDVLNSSFYELVNHYRVRAAQLELQKNRHDSILAIAMAVGFNSKSTFNAAFKRVTEMTPSQYRAIKLAQRKTDRSN